VITPDTLAGVLAQIGAGDVTTWQRYAAWVVVFVLVLAFIAAITIRRYRAIEPDQRKQLYQIKPQIISANPVQVTVERAQGFQPVKPQVRAHYVEEDADPSEPGVRDEVAALIATIRATLPSVPGLAVRGAVEGVLILATGTVVWASIEWLDWLLDPSGPVPGRELLVWTAQWLPSSDLVLSIGLLLVLWWWDLVVGSWWLVGLVLVVGAVALAAVDRRTAEDLSVRLYPDRRELLRRVAVVSGLVLLAFIVPNALLTVAGVDSLATIASVGIGSLALLGVMIYGVASLRYALVERQSQPDESTAWVAGYLLLRKTFGLVALVALPVAVYLGGRAAWTALLWTLANPLVAVVIVLATVAGLVTAVQYVWPDADEGVHRALSTWLRSLTVRSWVFARGIPAMAMILSMLLAWTFGFRYGSSLPLVNQVPILSGLVGWLVSLGPVFLTGVIVASVARTITYFWSKTKYYFVDFREGNGGPRGVLIGLFPPIEDADGEVLYVARVADHELCHRDVDALVRDMDRVIADAFDGRRSPRMTESRYYWQRVQFGAADLDAVRGELRGDVRSRLSATIQKYGRVDADAIDEDLKERYPAEYVEYARAHEQAYGNVNREEGQYVYAE
jgi:hypothetical protein